MTIRCCNRVALLLALLLLLAMALPFINYAPNRLLSGEGRWLWQVWPWLAGVQAGAALFIALLCWRPGRFPLLVIFLLADLLLPALLWGAGGAAVQLAQNGSSLARTSPGSGLWLALALCAALTTWVRAGFNNVMAPWKVNSFTFPFVFCTWMFLLAARAMHGLPTTHMADPALPAAFSSLESIRFGDLAVYWLKGIGQVFLINSWVTGICFLAGLFLCSRWAALWAAIGSALALLTVIALKASGSDISDGLYGYSPVLTAIALATVFYKPNFRSALWAVLGILVTVFIQAGMYMLMAPVGIATLTGPFCITTWLFLLPLVRFDDEEKPDHSNWYPENKKHLAAQQPGAKTE